MGLPDLIAMGLLDLISCISASEVIIYIDAVLSKRPVSQESRVPEPALNPLGRRFGAATLCFGFSALPH